MTNDEIKAELARLDAEDATKDQRINAIKAIARDNAVVALDQDQIDEYEDNLADTLAELFPDLTDNEYRIAFDTYNKLTGKA